MADVMDSARDRDQQATLPAEVLVPASAEELAAALGEAAARGQAVVPWGAGTLQHLGGAPPPGAMALRTGTLDRIVEYTPADLTITVEAGATLGAIQAALGTQGQWLPWDPPVPASATIGGLLAAGASGPLRLGYGTPRDWVLGMRVALGDGRLVKSGGKVVKNVAGYDTHKLHIGALGTLGVILEATFKLAPLPEHSATLLLACRDRAEAGALAERLCVRPLAPVSLLLLDPATVRAHTTHAPADHPGATIVAVRFAGVAGAVTRQLQEARHAAASGAVIELDELAGQAFWQGMGSFAAPHASELLLRAGVPPADLIALMDALERYTPRNAAPPRIAGYGGVGLAYARWSLPEDVCRPDISGAVAALRAMVTELNGYVVIEDAPTALRSQLDLWGPPQAPLPLMRALKAQWDPRGILNPGRYVV